MTKYEAADAMDERACITENVSDELWNGFQRAKDRGDQAFAKQLWRQWGVALDRSRWQRKAARRLSGLAYYPF